MPGLIGVGRVGRHGSSRSVLKPLHSLFQFGEDGFLFGDWSELDELFTTSTGATAVAEDTNSVGLALDDRAWGARTLAQELAANPEIVANGDFATGDLTNWTSNNSGTGTSVYSDGAMRLVGTSSGNRGYRYQLLPLVSGRTYRITWTGSTASGSCTIGISTTVDLSAEIFGAVVGSGGSGIFTAGASNYLIIVTASLGGDATVDNISVKEIPGNHALQTTTTQRPLWRANSGKPYLSFDGSDDNLLSRYAPGPVGCLAFAGVCSGNSRMALGGELTPGRLYFGLNAAGALGAGVGSNSYVIHSDNVSRSGVTGVGLLTYDGSTVRLYWDGALIHSGAQSGAVGATPIRLGAGGPTASFFWSGAIYAALAMNRVPSAPEIALITSQFQRTYQ